jgi:hypothetical protein
MQQGAAAQWQCGSQTEICGGAAGPGSVKIPATAMPAPPCQAFGFHV